MATSHADRYDPTEPAQASRAGLLLSAGLLLAGVLLTVFHSRLILGLAAIGVGGTGLAIEALVRADRPVTKRQATITMGVAITASWIALSWGPWYGSLIGFALGALWVRYSLAALRENQLDDEA